MKRKLIGLPNRKLFGMKSKKESKAKMKGFKITSSIRSKILRKSRQILKKKWTAGLNNKMKSSKMSNTLSKHSRRHLKLLEARIQKEVRQEDQRHQPLE